MLGSTSFKGDNKICCFLIYQFSNDFNYSYCYLDDLMIGLGKTLNSLSGAVDTFVTGGIMLFNNYDMTDTTSYFYLLNEYSSTSPDAKNIGLTVATIFREFFNIVVPNYEVDY